MKKNEQIQFIKDFLNNREVFFEKLEDYGIFNKSIFHQYAKTVYLLNNMDLDLEQRFSLVVLIWEISYKIQNILGSHSDPDDYVFIDNLGEDDIRQISNILYYVANWFSYKKEMEESSLTIGSW